MAGHGARLAVLRGLSAMARFWLLALGTALLIAAFLVYAGVTINGSNLPLQKALVLTFAGAAIGGATFATLYAWARRRDREEALAGYTTGGGGFNLPRVDHATGLVLRAAGVDDENEQPRDKLLSSLGVSLVEARSQRKWLENGALAEIRRSLAAGSARSWEPARISVSRAGDTAAAAIDAALATLAVASLLSIVWVGTHFDVSSNVEQVLTSALSPALLVVSLAVLMGRRVGRPVLRARKFRGATTPSKVSWIGRLDSDSLAGLLLLPEWRTAGIARRNFDKLLMVECTEHGIVMWKASGRTLTTVAAVDRSAVVSVDASNADSLRSATLVLGLSASDGTRRLSFTVIGPPLAGLCIRQLRGAALRELVASAGEILGFGRLADREAPS